MKKIPRKNPDGTLTGAFKKIDFPKEFYWGAATSSHQIEGGNNNDWTQWEISDKRKKQLVKMGKNPFEYYSRNAADSYNKFGLDFAFAKQMGHNCTRLSIEWSRIEPEEGYFNQKEIDHYIEVIDTAKRNGLEPFVTLWHFTNPIWFANKGGWSNSSSPVYFARYAKKIATALKGRVKFYMTLNEPMVSNNQGYLIGYWPPSKVNPIQWLIANGSMVSAHNYAYDAIKSVDSKAQIGFAQHMVWSKMYKENLYTKLNKKVADYVMNDYFIKGVEKNLDFIGVNYYFWNPLGMEKEVREKIVKNDLGWDLIPEGLYQVVKDASKYGKPIYITEHGLADAENSRRPQYISDSLTWLKKAMEEGADVKGYMHWSLLDNFEWAEGFEPRFGLIEVVY